MLYLVLAIAASFTITVLIKLNETRGARTQVVIASNYISATVIGWCFSLYFGFERISSETLWLSLGGGLLWPGTFFLLMYGIRRYGLALTGPLCRLSLIVPVLFALLFLGETLTVNAGLGLLAAFAAFFLFNPIGSGELKRADQGAIWFFPLLIFCFGLVDLWVNLFNHMGPASEKFVFVTLIFTFSNFFAWAAVGLKRIPIDKSAVVRGLILGIPNIFATYFLMQCLNSQAFRDNSAVAYTVYSVLGVALAFAAGTLIWRERVTHSSMLGVGAVIAAITLMGW